MPDTWRDALLRPIAMAAPDAMVYVEIMAPDFRFVFVLALALVWLIAGWRMKWRLSATMALFAFILLAFYPWQVTSGNGRYFIPVLLLVGPLCLALVYWLPFTRSMKMAIALLMMSVQIFAVNEASPWQRWSLTNWAEAPFFGLVLPQSTDSGSPTYITVSSNSFSIIAPMFGDSSRWTNIASLKNARDDSLNERRLKAILIASKSLKLVVPSVVAYTTALGLPNELIGKELNRLLAPQQLALKGENSCKLLLSKGIEKMLGAEKAASGTVTKTGFWICDLQYPVEVAAPRHEAISAQIESVFEQLEKTCPRFFPQGTAFSTKIEGGTSRAYSESDMKLYVMDDGRVYYKYWKGLNAQSIGLINEVLHGTVKMDCDHIRGRSGLPWEREI